MPRRNTQGASRTLRNPVARAASMHKGGVHEKTEKAKRQQRKQALKKKLKSRNFDSFFVKVDILNRVNG